MSVIELERFVLFIKITFSLVASVLGLDARSQENSGRRPFGNDRASISGMAEVSVSHRVNGISVSVGLEAGRSDRST